METSALFFTVKFMKPLRILILPNTSGQWWLHYHDLSCLSSLVMIHKLSFRFFCLIYQVQE